MKHSAGPWKYESPPNLTGQAHVVLAGDDEFMVCECYEDDDTQNEANARLIAAAPELLSALKILVDQYQSSGDFMMGGNLTNKGFLKGITILSDLRTHGVIT